MASSNREAELKQQGALEAAADPNSSVSPEAAEKKVMQEAKKAGSVAYEFDPNASTEEKRAQMQSVSFSGFAMMLACTRVLRRRVLVLT